MQMRIGISHAMIATLIVAAYPGAGASPVGTPKSLILQEARTATIEANRPYNFTGIRIEAGRSYQFTVASPAWNDGVLVTDAAGYSSAASAAQLRRHLDYKLMALVGEIFASNSEPASSTGARFLIGLGRSWKATHSGYLVAYANDCMVCYDNNSRVITLTVKRTQ